MSAPGKKRKSTDVGMKPRHCNIKIVLHNCTHRNGKRENQSARSKFFIGGSVLSIRDRQMGPISSNQEAPCQVAFIHLL